MLVFHPPGLASNGQLTVIELNYRPASEVIPIIEPLLAPSDRISGEGYRIFLITAADSAPRIQAIIDQLDQAPKQVAITVVQGQAAIETLNALKISGRVTVGDHVRIGVGDHRGQPDDSIRLDARNTRSNRRGSDVQRVLTQNGSPATVYAGLIVPYTVSAPNHRNGRNQPIVEYRHLQTGILVTPHLSDDRVSLDIDIRQDQPPADHSGIQQTGRMRTRIQARLGEWIDIGSILSNTSRSQTGLVDGASKRTSSQTHVFVRVDLVP
jgi:hypothetical protein